MVPLAPEHRLQKVSDLMESNGNGWNTELVRTTFNPQLAIKVIQTPTRITAGEDDIWWPANKEGEYTVKSGYQEMWQAGRTINLNPSGSESIETEVWKGIWSAQIPQKVKMFIWKCCWNILPVKENLCKRRVVRTGICTICNKEIETVEHSLLFCDWVRPVWLGSQLQIIPQRQNVTSFHVWFLARIKLFQQSPAIQVFAMVSLCITLWQIWKQRNSAYFDQKNPCPMATIIQANSFIKEILQVNENQQNSQDTQLIKSSQQTFWRPPRPGIIKINTDAGFNVQKAIGSAGIVARDFNGDLLCGFSKKFPATSPLIAEGLALREALAIAVNLRMSKVLFESDCLELVAACRKEYKRGVIANIVQDILFMAGKLEWVGFTWTAKGGNTVAHHVAKLHLRDLLPIHWRWGMPFSLQECFLKDKMNLQGAPPPSR